MECPYCGSTDLEPLNKSFGLFRCSECDARFEEDEDEVYRHAPAKNHVRRKMRHNKYSEED